MFDRSLRSFGHAGLSLAKEPDDFQLIPFIIQGISFFRRDQWISNAVYMFEVVLYAQPVFLPVNVLFVSSFVAV